MRYEPKPSGPKLVRLDIDPREMSRLEPDVGIVADSADACRALYAALERRGRRGDAARTQEIAAARARALALLQRAQPQVEYLRVIRSILPRDGFIVPELSQVGFTTYTDALPIYAPRTYVTEGHQGTLGFGFPTALGVKVANPGRAVLSITGDGGFMFGVQELATATQYGIGTVIVLFNNRSYANVLRDQEQGSGRVVASTFENPDFLKLAEAFDCSARRVKSPAELGKALEAVGPPGAHRSAGRARQRSLAVAFHPYDRASIGSARAAVIRRRSTRAPRELVACGPRA
jgi:acetolactate synthase-1/2/3 large subunit